MKEWKKINGFKIAVHLPKSTGYTQKPQVYTFAKMKQQHSTKGK